MIFIFVNNVFFILQTHLVIVYLKTNYNLDCELITSLDSFIDNGRNIIIPFGINESKECFNRGIKNTLVVSDEIYDMLDNKASCFTFAKLVNVPYVDTFLTEPNQNILKELTEFIYKHSNYDLFLIKPRYSLDSKNIQVLNKIDLINTKIDLDEMVVQPYLNKHNLYNLNAVCHKGEIIEFIVLTQRNNFRNENLFGKDLFNFERHIVSTKDSNFHRILDTSKKLIEATKYSGLIDIDFLCNEKESLFLEINPRVSGQIITVVDSKMIYIDKLILNYIVILESKKNKTRLLKLMKSNKCNFTKSTSGINLRYPIIYGMLSLILLIIAAIIFWKFK